MKEIYEVTIEYCKVAFDKQIEKTEVKVFSTEELAVEFLTKNGFVYGAPYPFKQIGWYYSKNINVTIDRMTRFITASITKVKLDDEAICVLNYCDYIIGKQETISE